MLGVERVEDMFSFPSGVNQVVHAENAQVVAGVGLRNS